MIKPSQVKAARAILDLGVRELAKMADCATGTITRFERGKGGLQVSTAQRLKKALETSGLVFIEENGGGAGVRLRESGTER
jgi:predicted transcriptional regulator